MPDARRGEINAQWVCTTGHSWRSVYHYCTWTTEQKDMTHLLWSMAATERTSTFYVGINIWGKQINAVLSGAKADDWQTLPDRQRTESTSNYLQLLTKIIHSSIFQTRLFLSSGPCETIFICWSLSEQFRVSSWPQMHFFGLWVETGERGKNPCRREDIVQTPQRKFPHTEVRLSCWEAAG